VADVADKGMGAALYMALSRTLLRTYAVEYHTRPDFVMTITNRRLLADTDVTMFVTAFYAVLDPLSNELTYCNAGHHPPYLVRADGELQLLDKTGMALGVLTGQTWEQRVVRVDPGDALALYTDGLVDAQNEQGAFFGPERLRATLRAHAGRSAPAIQTAMTEAVRGFMGDAAPFDDITVMVAVNGE
jgi:serine phosphatase RsbU (regulator of sigma subunit)